MARYYFSPDVLIGTQTLLSPEESRHLKADRIAVGKTVMLGDGKGHVYTAVLKEWSPEGALLEPVEILHSPEKPHLLRCCLALLKNQNRLDWIVEKLTELGASELMFFPAHRSVRKRLTSHQISRMEKIIRESGKQTGRTFFPGLLWLENWHDFIRFLEWEGGRVFPAFPESSTTLWKRLKESKRERVSLVTGPEGDFTPQEKSALSRLPRSSPVRLTEEVLRSETAALFGVSLISAFLENDEDSPEDPGL